MNRRRRAWPISVRERAVEMMKQGASTAQISIALGVPETTIACSWRPRAANVGLPRRRDWSRSDIETARSMVASGATVEAIASVIGRRPNGVRRKLEKLGTVTPSLPRRSRTPSEKVAATESAITINVAATHLAALAQIAAERRMSASELVAELVRTILRDGLVPAVLDTGDDARPMLMMGEQPVLLGSIVNSLNGSAEGHETGLSE
jgi:hypothetical protein